MNVNVDTKGITIPIASGSRAGTVETLVECAVCFAMIRLQRLPDHIGKAHPEITDWRIVP